MYYAAISGNHEILKILLDNGGIELVRKDANPFLLSARYGRLECVKMFLASGVDITKQDAAGRTALHLAAWFGHADVIKILLTSGADISALDSLGNTALHHCAWFGCYHAAKLLLEAGATVNAQNKAGDTPLHLACHHNDSGIVSALLDHQADTKIKNKLNQTAENIAEIEDRSDIIEILQKRDGQGAPSMVHEVKYMNKILEEMILAQEKQNNILLIWKTKLEAQSNILLQLHQKHGEMKRTLNDVASLAKEIEKKAEGILPLQSRFTYSWTK